MESAIPPHLVRPRLRQARVGERFRPPGVAVVPRFDASIGALSIACLGLEHPPHRFVDEAEGARDWLDTALRDADAPHHVELAEFSDRAGIRNWLWAGYWRNNGRNEGRNDGFQAWHHRIGHRWTADEGLAPSVGRFLEVLQPTVDRIEAITDGEPLHGLARLADRLSGPVREQGYWGSMRDRIALSQTDPMAPSGHFQCEAKGSLVTIRPPSNLCVIRTGQDWSAGSADEQARYLEQLEPTMKASADLLDASGDQFGCLANRYCWLLDAQGRRRSATFGLSVWRSLAQLERWAETHHTHLESYVGSVRHAQHFGAATRFSRYHEVLVPTAQQARFEYRNCHPATGLLAAQPR